MGRARSRRSSTGGSVSRRRRGGDVSAAEGKSRETTKTRGRDPATGSEQSIVHETGRVGATRGGRAKTRGGVARGRRRASRRARARHLARRRRHRGKSRRPRRERPRRERPRRERPRRERPRVRDAVESRAIRGGSASTFTREEDARSGDGVVAAVGRGGAGGGAAESDVRNGGWIETRRERRRGTVRRVRGTDRVVFAVETEEEGTRRSGAFFFFSRRYLPSAESAPSFLSRGEERRGDAPYTLHPTRLPTRSVRRADPRLARARGGCPGLRR